MIGYVRGQVTGIYNDFCFVETAGIGYRIFISGRDRMDLHVGADVRLVTYLAVREDALTLYGFTSEEAYELFVQLISVSKIGPKVAMGILTAVTPEAFSSAILMKDVSALTKLPGIGKKTAEHLILELKDKLGSISSDMRGTGGENFVSQDGGLVGEAVSALRSLGYEAGEVTGIVTKLASDFSEPAALIGAALREIGRMGRQG